MATRTTVQVEGLRELGAALKALGNVVGTRIARASTAAGAKVIKAQAIANVIRSPSVETGSLRDSIIVKRVGKGETRLTSEHIVTVRGRGKPKNKKGQRINRAPHASMVEFGTVNMPAEPFLRPAFETKKHDAVKAITDSLQRGIDRAVKRAAKK